MANPNEDLVPPPAANPIERRRFRRVRLTRPLPAEINRIETVIMDISARGACVAHSSVLPRGVPLKLTFLVGGNEYAATARITSARVISLGGPKSLPLYESHLALVAIPHVTEKVIARLVQLFATE